MLKTSVWALALAASLPTAALADDAIGTSEVVRFHDLNLASPAGIATLERRVNSAARRVCGYYDTVRLSYIVPKEVSKCMAGALTGARQDMALKTGFAVRKG